MDNRDYLAHIININSNIIQQIMNEYRENQRLYHDILRLMRDGANIGYNYYKHSFIDFCVTFPIWWL